MALVDYGSSDESLGDEEEQMETNLSQEKSVKDVPNAPSSSSLIQSSSSVISSGLQRLTGRSTSGRVQILAPSFDDLDSSSDDDDESVSRFRKTTASSSGSGLRALLPPVKTSSSKSTASATKIISQPASSHTFIRPDVTLTGEARMSEARPVTVTSLIPHSLKRPVTVSSADKSFNNCSKKKKIEEDGEEAAVDPRSFFSLSDDGDADGFEQNVHALPSLSSVEMAPEVSSSLTPVVHSTPVYSVDCGRDMSESQLKKKIAQRFGDDANSADKIELIDININEEMGGNRDFLKTISQEKQDEEAGGPAPNTTMKRKHHITYLAHQAKARELALKEEWARNRITRNQSKAKYGFK